MAKLRTIILVTFVTLLIWAFAEGQSVQTKRTNAEIEFPSVTAGTYAARVSDEGWRGRVELLVEGSTTSLDRVDSELGRPITLSPGMESVPRESGEHTVDLRQALRNLPQFRSHGVTVVSVEPDSVRLVVDELRTVDVPVRVEVPPGEVEGAPEARPAQVPVKMPARLAESLAGTATVVARIRPEDLARFEPGRQVTVPRVRLEPGPELAGVQPPVEILPPQQVDVQLVVRSKSDTVVLETVPIDIRIAPTELARWEITVPPEEQFLKDVRVTGPSELIGRIRRGDADLEIRAYVRLPYDLLEQGVTSYQAEFTRLPSPLTIEVEDREVRLMAKRREEPAGNGNGVE